eukprot:359441-Chlamydomonas_euryale.AAC.1
MCGEHKKATNILLIPSPHVAHSASVIARAHALGCGLNYFLPHVRTRHAMGGYHLIEGACGEHAEAVLVKLFHDQPDFATNTMFLVFISDSKRL